MKPAMTHTLLSLRRPAVVLALLLAGVAAQAQPTTVILVRHAEKANKSAATPLKEPKGFLRARALANAVGEFGISAVVASEFLRTQQTVAATASHLGLEESVVQLTDPQAIADEILGRYRGRTVLVAGHSNTVPQMIEALGGPSLCPNRGGVLVKGECRIPDREYDNLYVVRIFESGPAGFMATRYGEPSGR
jgi:phosphohistidine phosphatase SixA